MKTTNEPNPENRDTRKNTEENLPENQNQFEPNSENNPIVQNESEFMKTLKKIGFSVWLAVMIIGAGLAFIAAIFLL